MGTSAVITTSVVGQQGGPHVAGGLPVEPGDGVAGPVADELGGRDAEQGLHGR